MAKKQDLDAEDSQEKQEPEKPRKKSQGMSTPVLIGIIGGIVFIQAILIIIIVKMLIVPAAPTVNSDQSGDKQKTEISEKKVVVAEDSPDSPLSDDDKKKLVQYEIKNIPATLRGMDKSAFFTVNVICIPKEKDLVEKLNKKFEEDVTGKVLIAETQYRVNDIFSKYTKEQLDNLNRDTVNINMLKQLKPAFDRSEINLKKVLVTWAFY